MCHMWSSVRLWPALQSSLCMNLLCVVICVCATTSASGRSRAFFSACFLCVVNMKRHNLITIVHPCDSHITPNKLLQDCTDERLLSLHCNPCSPIFSAPPSKHKRTPVLPTPLAVQDSAPFFFHCHIHIFCIDHKAI